MSQYVASYTMETDVQDIHLSVNVIKKEHECLNINGTSCSAVIMTMTATKGKDILSLNFVDFVRSKNLENN